ncbi:MAG: metallophosphoesterase family protein [Planctomycetota bacterium]|nr:metallophosphoesterase family protein [Planctomycetota bacterium]MDA1248228.1 metallophosphoesterase family protein [Planctomycetota bacterium]
MKILLLADIHSNWPALRAIDETFDVCLFVGDLVDYGTDPVPCIEWALKNVSSGVRGNHDHAVAQRIPVRKKTGLSQLAGATRPRHWEILQPEHLKYLARLPVTRRVVLEDKTYYLVHATPRDPFDEYLKNDLEGWQERLQGIQADFVCVGHSHIPFVIDLGGTTVINPGSVGQPRDGDPRAAYCVIEDGQVSLRRVEYDIDETVEHMRASGVPASILELGEHFLRTGGRILPSS